MEQEINLNERPSTENQEVYNDKGWARMNEYLWEFNDSRFIEESPFFRNLNFMRDGYCPENLGVRTRIELERFREFNYDYYCACIRQLLAKANRSKKR